MNFSFCSWEYLMLNSFTRKFGVSEILPMLIWHDAHVSYFRATPPPAHPSIFRNTKEDFARRPQIGSSVCVSVQRTCVELHFYVMRAPLSNRTVHYVSSFCYTFIELSGDDGGPRWPSYSITQFSRPPQLTISQKLNLVTFENAQKSECSPWDMFWS